MRRRFGEVFRSEEAEISRSPFRAPKANAFAERSVGTVRGDCLDWLLLSSLRQLECVLHIYVDHDNSHGPSARSGLRHPIPGLAHASSVQARQTTFVAATDSAD